MPAPAMRIPFATDLQGFNRQMDAAADKVGTTLKVAARSFSQFNSEITAESAIAGAALARNVGGGLISTIAKISAGKLAIAAFALTAGAAIGEARRQLEEMVEVAEKAGKSNVTSEFFQRFTAGAKNLKVDAKDLEGALSNAFNATKEQLDQLNPVLAKLQEFFLAGVFSEGDKRTGLELFKNADSQDQKIRAILVSMTELEAVGARLESLNLAELVFGTNLADNIRRGTTSAQELLATLDKADGARFSNDLVRAADEVDKRLRKANETLEQNLRPAWDGLADVAISIKNHWASIVELIAKAAAIMPSTLNILKDQVARDEEALRNGTALFGLPQLQSGRQGLIDRVARNRQKIQEIETPANQPASDFNSRFGFQTTENVPTPRDNPRRGFIPPPAEQESKTSFDRQADSIERRSAALEAEAKNIDLGTAARERARVVAELQTVAMQANSEAGLGNNVITAEQQVRIDAVSEAYARAAVAIENARSPLRQYARDAADVNRALQEAAVSGLRGIEDGLIGVLNGTKTAKEAFKDLANSIISDLARIAIKQAITGPIASALGFALPGRAAGGPVAGGSPYIVGERGPELFVPGRSGQIVPNNLMRGAGGGVVVQITSAPTFATDMSPGDRALINQDMQRNNAELQASILRNLRSGLSNDSNFLTRG